MQVHPGALGVLVLGAGNHRQVDTGADRCMVSGYHTFFNINNSESKIFLLDPVVLWL